MFKKLAFLFTLILVVVFLGRLLNPFSTSMFDFHDETQPARVSEFTFNLKNLQIPPRLAPHFSHNMGFPVFNFYAPFSYWITSFINLVGFDVASSIQLSFLLAIVAGFIGMYVLLRVFFPFAASLIGASLFVAAPWTAVEIFIRGNLGEVWLMSFIPWVLYFFHRNNEESSPVIFILTVLIAAFAITSHNVLSLLLLPWIVIFIFSQKKRRRNFIALALALLSSSYFLLPAILESHFTHAAELAKQTNYADHFLCLGQLWNAPFWGYGGSTVGCQADGLSFMLGKIQLILAIGGGMMMLFEIWKKKTVPLLFVLILLFTIITIFLTLYQSAFVWQLLAPIFSLFQFPWRFLALAVFGNAFLGAYLLSTAKLQAIQIGVVGLALFVIVFGAKYFVKPAMTKNAFNDRYLSQEYISEKAAYAIQEYLPKWVDYQTWKNYDPAAIEKVTVNLHYFPFWKIYADDKPVTPQSFDKLGRPTVMTTASSTIYVKYEQTLVEKLGNALTIMTLMFMVMIMFYKPLWQKIKRI